jgi:ubiquinone/menaquinone biosynthesis C-methylase UbiE
MKDHYGDIAAFYDMIYGTDIDYEAEADGIYNIVQPSPATRMLDVGCGTGSHLLHLARRGCLGTGIDISQPMLRRGRQKAEAEGLALTFVRGDMIALDSLRFQQRFYAAFSCYALGLESGFAEFEGTIRGVYPLLRERGRLVFNLMNAVCGFFDTSAPDVSFDACRSDGKKAVWFYQTVTQGDRQQLTAVYLLDGGGGVELVTHRLAISLFTLEQAREILLRCGFDIVAVYGSLTGGALAEFRGEEPAMWVVAERR